MADAPLIGGPAKNTADFGVCPWVANNLVVKTGLGPAGYDAPSECSLRVRTRDRQVRATYPGAGQSGILCRHLQGCLQKIPPGDEGMLLVEETACLRFGVQMSGLLENLKE